MIIEKPGDSIMQQPYPKADELTIHPDSIDEINWVKNFISNIRRIRSERDIDPRKPLPVEIKGGTEQEKIWLQRNQHYLQKLGKITQINVAQAEPEDAVVALVGNMTLLVPLAELIDINVERERLQKTINKLQNNKTNIEQKLNNQQFLQRAPQNIVHKEKQRLKETESTIEKLQRQYQRIC